MPFRLTKNLKTVLDAQAANGVGNTIASQEYKDIMKNSISLNQLVVQIIGNISLCLEH